MDLYNPKNFLKASKIDDNYWLRSWRITERLIKALEEDNESEILMLLNNPGLHGGRT